MRRYFSREIIPESEVWSERFNAIAKRVGMKDCRSCDFKSMVVVLQDTFNGISCIGSARSSSIFLLLLIIVVRRFGCRCRSLSLVLRRASLLLAGVRWGWSFILDSRSFLCNLHSLLLGRGRGLLFKIESPSLGTLGFRNVPKA